MERRAVIGLLAALPLLSACLSVAEYKPYITDISDPRALASDEAACQIRAQAYRAPTDLASFGTAAGVGAGSNLAGAAINPLVPAFGAIGSIGVAGMKALGLTSADQVRVYLRCLDHRSMRSGAYDMLDPNL